MQPVYIAGLGSYLPPRIVSNDELSQTLDTSDDWIRSHTGISNRHLADEHDSATSMGFAAAQKALDSAGIPPEEVGMILLSSTTLDYGPIPATACLIQEALGAKNAVAFDIAAACSGFVYGIQLAKAQMQLDPRPVLVIGSEMMSRKVDWTDKTTCVLFGDAAGAAVLVPGTDPNRGLIDTYMQSDSSGACHLVIEGGSRMIQSQQIPGPHYLQMEGKAVFSFAIKIVPEIFRTILQRNNLTVGDVDWFLPHQANLRIIKSAASRLEVPLERFFLNVQNVANTASASIPVALVEMESQGLLKPGTKIVTAGFGAGLTYGGNLIIW